MSTEPDDDAMPTGRVIDHFDLEIVAFIVRWAPYGGPPEDECLPRFGMAADRLRARFCEIVRHGRRGHLDGDDLALLERATTLPVIAKGESSPSQDRRQTTQIGKPLLRQGIWRWH